MEWTYIDEFDFEKDWDSIHCDTRDFHILGVEKDENIKKIRSNGNSKFTKSEIKEFLKSIETATGGKGEWRFLKWGHEPKVGWWKYLRFKKLNNEYLGYTETGGKSYPIDRKFCTPADINKRSLGFSEED